MSNSTNPGCFPATANQTGIYRASSTLPLGRWHVMANGRIHFLDITSVSGDVVTGEYNGEAIEDSHWDAATQVLSFNRFIPDVGGGRSLLQQFRGYLMHYDEGMETKWRMAGILIGTSTAPPPQRSSSWMVCHIVPEIVTASAQIRR